MIFIFIFLIYFVIWWASTAGSMLFSLIATVASIALTLFIGSFFMKEGDAKNGFDRDNR
jgi:hypothetical protein